jgi:TctA family transporter
MGRLDRISSIVLIIVAMTVCVGSIRIGLGTFHAPGSGFVPFLAAIFLGLFSIPTLIRATREKKSEITSSPEPIDLRKGIKAIVGLFVYISLLPILGYVIGTFLLMIFFFKGVENLKWKWALITAIITVVTSELIFDVWLQGMLPVGFIDFKEWIVWIF